MSTLYITEYEELAKDGTGAVIQAGKEPAITTQTVSFTGTAGVSAAFNARTNYVRLYADGAGFLLFGVSPTAVTASGTPIALTTAEYFGVIPAQKVSAVT